MSSRTASPSSSRRWCRGRAVRWAHRHLRDDLRRTRQPETNVLGKDDARMKDIGTRSRAAIARLLGNPVYLDLHVKVAKEWQRDPKQLRRLGSQVYRRPEDTFLTVLAGASTAPPSETGSSPLSPPAERRRRRANATTVGSRPTSKPAKPTAIAERCTRTSQLIDARRGLAGDCCPAGCRIRRRRRLRRERDDGRGRLGTGLAVPDDIHMLVVLDRFPCDGPGGAGDSALQLEGGERPDRDAAAGPRHLRRGAVGGFDDDGPPSADSLSRIEDEACR